MLDRCMHQGFEDVVEARLGDSPDVATFFLELHTLLERLLRYRFAYLSLQGALTTVYTCTACLQMLFHLFLLQRVSSNVCCPLLKHEATVYSGHTPPGRRWSRPPAASTRSWSVSWTRWAGSACTCCAPACPRCTCASPTRPVRSSHAAQTPSA